MTLADRIAVMRGGLIQQLDTPHAIYSRPVNRFVAGFIGSPGMNFLAGAVEVRDGKPRFVAEDLDVPLATYAFDRNAVVAGPAELGVRPEHIGVNSGEDWPYARKVAIEVVEPMGSDTLIWAKLGRQDIAMRLPSERAPRVGDQVSIGFDPMRASLFNASTGMRL
jgi:multiple sugar transport system ATP-binding protein